MAGLNTDADHPMTLGSTMLGPSDESFMTFKADFLPASVKKAEKGILIQDMPQDSHVSAFQNTVRRGTYVVCFSGS